MATKQSEQKVASKQPPGQKAMSQYRTNRCLSTVIKPLRIFQFLVMLPLFAFALFMTVMDPTPINFLVCIILIVLSGGYLFVLGVEVIAQFASSTLPIYPMFAFSFLGIFLFGTAGTLFIFKAYTELAVQIVTLTLCLLIALIFLIDVTLMLVFWKRRCSVCKRCCSIDVTELLLRKELQIEAPRDERPPIVGLQNGPCVIGAEKRDLTTSVSDVRLPPEADESATPDHSYRKTERPRRRQYIDCTTCVPSLCKLDVAQIQTEPRPISAVESQTPEMMTRETPMQTLSRCEFCQRQMQFASPLDETSTSIAQCSQYPSQWAACPAILQFVRGGIGVPCCPGCKCATGTMQTQRQQQQQQQQQSQPQYQSTSERTNYRLGQVLQPTNGTLTSTVSSDNDGTTRFTGVAETVTKLTLASFYVKPSTRIQNGRVNSVSKRKIDITEVKEDERRDGEEVRDVYRKAVVKKDPEESARVGKIKGKPTETKIEKKAPAILKEKFPALKRKPTEEKLSTDRRIEKREKPVVELKPDDTAERKEEEEVEEEDVLTICQRPVRASEDGNAAKVEDSTNTATQMSTSRVTTPTGKSKSKVFLHLKSNKVDPTGDVLSDENRPGGSVERETSCVVAQTVQEDGLSVASNLTEDQTKDICSYCKRHTSSIPTSDNTRYYTVFKDKKGRYFCEFCAPLDCKKVITRIDVNEFKKIRCTSCRLSIRGRGNNTFKSDICPKCGQTQKVVSPSST